MLGLKFALNEVSLTYIIYNWQDLKIEFRIFFKNNKQKQHIFISDIIGKVKGRD